MSKDFPPWLRYTVVFVALGLIIFEAIIYPGPPRYALLILYTALLGLPSVLGLGERQ